MVEEKQKHSVWETGHGKNVSVFNSLIIFLTALGNKYSPKNLFITLAEMQLLYTKCYNIMEQFATDLVIYILAVDARQDAYDFLAKYATNAVNLLQGSRATKRNIADAKAALKKLRGPKKKTIEQAPVESTPVLGPGDIGAADAGNETATKLKRSVSQMSFDSRVEHFKELVKLLSAIPEYDPNEDELKISFFNTYIASLENLNKNTDAAGSKVMVNRISRDELLYDPVNGLIECSRESKKYVKGAFGSTSPEYKDVVKFKFHDYQ
jgi:hypothetical protein